MVERRAGAQDSFGKGHKKRMRFGEFVRCAAAGDDSLYLSTQQVCSAMTYSQSKLYQKSWQEHCNMRF